MKTVIITLFAGLLWGQQTVVMDKNGNVNIPGTYYSNGSPISGGGPWTRTGTTISPTNAGDSLAMGTTVLTGATLSLANILVSPRLDTTLGVAGFSILHSAPQFDVGQPLDETLDIGYNATNGCSRLSSSDTAICLQLEGSYNSGAHYTEGHLIFVDSTDTQYRPWSWRINKSAVTTQMVGMLTGSEIDFLNPANLSQNYFQATPTGLLIQTSGAVVSGNTIVLSDASQVVTLQRNGPAGSDFYTSGWHEWRLPTTKVIATASDTQPALFVLGANTTSTAMFVQGSTNVSGAGNGIRLQGNSTDGGLVSIYVDYQTTAGDMSIGTNSFRSNQIYLHNSGGTSFNSQTDPGASKYLFGGLAGGGKLPVCVDNTGTLYAGQNSGAGAPCP